MGLGLMLTAGCPSATVPPDQPDAAADTRDAATTAVDAAAIDAAGSLDATVLDATACPAGFDTCGATACATPLTTTDDCGGCGVVCGAANGTPSCTDSTCTFACDPGFAHCGVVPGTGCESDLTSSGDHCGACGRSCIGQACAASLCVPLPLTPTGRAWQAALSSAGLYVMRVNAVPPSSYELVRFATDGTGETSVHVAPARIPGGVAVDDEYVYFSELDNRSPAVSTVFRKAHTATTSAAPEVLFRTGGPAYHLTLVEGVLYWQTARYSPGTLAARPLAGGPEAPLSRTSTQVSLVTSMAVGTTQIYFSRSDETLWTAPRNGGEPTQIPGARAGYIGNGGKNLALRGDTAYWVRRSGPMAERGVYRYQPGGTVEPVLLREVLDVFLAEDDLYVFTNGPATRDRGVYVMPVAGGPLVELAHGFASYLDGAGADADFLYATPEAIGPGPAYRIVR
jgi:hypothetical protein